MLLFFPSSSFFDRQVWHGSMPCLKNALPANLAGWRFSVTNAAHRAPVYLLVAGAGLPGRVVANGKAWNLFWTGFF